MHYLESFRKEEELISQYGENAAFIVWSMGLYLNATDLKQLAIDNLTDCSDDKKIDFLQFDQEQSTLYIVQGYYTQKVKDSAPANKASDLNCAAAWLTHGEISHFPKALQTLVEDIRMAIVEGEISEIELIYVHNCDESKEVQQELQTASSALTSVLRDYNIIVNYKEFGNRSLSRMFMNQAANIVVTEDVECPFSIQYEEKGRGWNSAIMTVTGEWLRELFNKYKGDLYSANYRGYLGLGRKRINSGIKNSAEKEKEQFWAYNNGITILTNHYEKQDKITKLSGISIINGAQTSGSLGILPPSVDLQDVKVLARIIESTDPELISAIVKYNNTQNKITAWDGYGNDSNQQEIQRQFIELGFDYNIKRGFENHSSSLSVENSIQPILAFNGKYKDANRSKTAIFESRTLYAEAFEQSKARHILFVNVINSSLQEIKAANKRKIMNNDPTISNNDKLIYELFAPIKMKYYVLSVIGELLPKIFNTVPDKTKISFTPEFAKAAAYPYEQLVCIIKPIILFLVSQIAASISSEFISKYQDSSTILQVAVDVEGRIAGLKTIPQIDEMLQVFSKMVCNG